MMIRTGFVLSLILTSGLAALPGSSSQDYPVISVFPNCKDGQVIGYLLSISQPVHNLYVSVDHLECTFGDS